MSSPLKGVVMPSIVRRSSSAGSGCLMQTLGLVSFVVALITLPTIIGPIVFGLAGIALIGYGHSASRWLECDSCGSRVARKGLTVCPGCRQTFR